MKALRIDLIASSLFGAGAQRVIALLANCFAEKGHLVRIITFNEGDAYSLDKRIERIRYHNGRVGNHTLRCTLKLINHYRKDEHRPDVAISFIRRMNFSSIIACKIFGIKIIACEHNNHLVKYDIVGNFAWNYLYRHANFITVLTDFDRQFFESRGSRVKVMPNPATFKPLVDNLHCRDKVILAVGSLNRYFHKGFDNLVEIVAPVLKAYPDWVLKIVGKGDVGKELIERQAELYEVSQQVSFLGFRSDVNAIMQKSAVFILPSRFEGLPMVLLEAMSQGMACIAYDCITGPSELIKDNFNGILVDDQNIDKMKTKLVELIRDTRLRDDIAHNAIRSLDKYSIENIYTMWEDLFIELNIYR